MDVRIGVTYTAKEIDLELAPETDRDTLKRDVEHALADDERVLWLTDSHDRMVAVPSGKIAYVEIGSPEGDRRIGFASGVTATGTVGAPPVELLDRRLLFVTGKGGVGKTTVAAALALTASQQGRRTLVCEVDAKGNLADFFESGEIGWDPVELGPDLFAMSMNTEESLKEYLKLQLRVPLAGRMGPVARSFDFVANAAPGVKEILTVGKLCYEVQQENYDLVVVDASATGHIVAQLAAPQAINELVKVGMVREQTSWMVEILADPLLTGAVIVSAPEEMPVNETLELVGRIRGEHRVDLAGVIVNRVLPELFGRGEEETFDALREEANLAALHDAVDGPVEPVLEGARLAVTLRRTRAEHLTRLRDELPDGLELLYLPYLFTRDYGVRATHAVAESLAAELGY